MRLPVRSAAALMLAIGVASCSDAPSVGPRPATAPGKGRLALVPVFSSAAAAVLSQRSAFAEVTFDHVRIVLVRPPSDTVKDTTIVFAPGAPPKTLDLTVEVRNVGESFDGIMDYTSNGVVVFHGTATVQSHAADEQAPPAQEIVVQYVGPGFNATRLTVSPKTVTVQAPGTSTFTAVAFDAAGGPIAGAPLSWSSSDPTVATVNANTGVMTTTGKRGTATITARTPTGVSDNGVATITLPPTGITLVSGGGQTGKAGAALAQPGVVRVVASDGAGVAGVTVTFAAPAGGSVGSASATTDATGQASTSLTLGGTVGPQSFAAAAGAFSVSIPATATPGDPSSILAFSGSGQADTVRRALRQPFVAKVTDRFGNPIAGVTVTWARTAGVGTLGGTTSVTNADGLASIGYTLGATVGTETVTATASGVAGAATFTATALTSGPAAIVAVSGSGQIGRATQVLGAPFVVRVTDDAGGPVSGVSVSWTAINGTFGASTTTTDAQGQSSNTMTLGGVVGAASATATAGGKSVTFTAAVQPGTVARLSFRAAPPTVAPGAVLAPAVQVELRDAAGNLTAAANGVTLALGANPGGSTLSGTLTRTSAVGVASFDDLKLDKAGVGYTLVASSAGVPDVTSAAFNITGTAGGAPFKLAITTQPSANAVSGVPLTQQPVIQIQDQAGIPVSGGTIQVSAVWSTGSERNNVVAANPATGAAAFTNLTVLGVGAGPITFSAQGLQPVSSNSVTVTAAPPASITLVDGQTLQPLPPSPPPSVTMTAGLAPVNPPAIKVSDAGGAGLSGVTIAYTVTRGGSPLFGGNATSNAQGIITFAALLISPSNLTVAGNYVFTATLTGVTGSPINLPVTVVPDAQAAVRFNTTTFPTSGTAGTALTPAITVSVTDQYANVVTAATNNVTMTISPSTGTLNAVVGGTLTRAAVTGIATFNDLTISLAGTNYTLTATVATVANGVSVVSPAFGIGSGAGTKFIVTANPTSPAPGGSSVITAQLADANNNPVATPTPRSVNWTLSGGTGTVAPTPTTTNAQGVATTTFTAPSSPTGSPVVTATEPNTGVTGSVTLTPSVPAAVTAVTPVNVAPASPSPLPASAYPAVRVTNAASAPVANVPVTFNFAGGSCFGPGERSSSVVNTDANGVAALADTNYIVNRTRENSCWVYASTTGIPQVIISVVIVPTPPIRSWIGVTSSAWNDATNWYSGVIPAQTDTVYVPTYLVRHPTLVAPTTIASLRFEDAGVLDLGAYVLTINGDLASGTITTSSNGAVILNGSGARTVSGLISAAVTIGSACTSYTIPANSGFLSTQNLTVNCPLIVQDAVLDANGNITVRGAAARLVMTGSTPFVRSFGDIMFDGGSEANSLTAGSLYVGGNLIINSTNASDTFVAGINHNTYFSNPTPGSNAAHTISILANAAPVFGRVSIAGLSATSTVTITRTLGAETLDVFSGGTLVVPDATAVRVGSTSNGPLTLHGGSRLTVNGSTSSVSGNCFRNTTPPATIDGTNTAVVAALNSQCVAGSFP